MNGFSFFKIKLEGGIGDCLRTLSIHKSLYLYNKNHGLQVFWTYKDNNPDWQRYYTELLNDFILSRAEFFRNVSEEIYKSLDFTELKGINLLTDLITFDSYSPEDSIGFPVTMNFDEKQQLERIYTTKADVNIVIQINGGVEHKFYQRYKEVIQSILEKFPKCRIFLIGSGYITVDNLLFTEYVTNLINRINLTQAFNLIQMADYFIGPDSFGKYARHWSRKKQTILVSKSNLLDRYLLQYCFKFLTTDPSVTLLGILPNKDFLVGNESDDYLISDINTIMPEEIVDTINL
jgi:hypothetical protein